MKRAVVLLLASIVTYGCMDADAVLIRDPCKRAGCSGVYQACWTGLYPGDEDKICLDSGASVKDGTIDASAVVGTDYGYGGSKGILVDEDDDDIAWVVAANDVVNGALGTIWANVYITDLLGAAQSVLEINDDNERTWMQVSAVEKPGIDGICSGVGSTVLYSTDAMSVDTWYRAGFSWDAANEVYKMRLCAGDGTGCDVTTEATSGTDCSDGWSTPAALLEFGDTAIFAYGAVPYYVSNLTILSTYGAADPMTGATF